MKELRKDKKWLYRKYWEENLTQVEIGRICQVSNKTIQYWLRKYKINIKPRAMNNFKDIIGKRFGKLIVLKYIKTEWKSYKNSFRRRQYLYECLCDCGNKKIISRNSLITCHIKSCGCLWGEKKRKPLGVANFNMLYHRYMKKAEKRNIEWALDKKYFKKITKQNCIYCNAKPNNLASDKGHNGVYKYSGIDRVDNSKGYVKSNCAPCCGVCNKMKLNMNVADFLNHIFQINRTILTKALG